VEGSIKGIRMRFVDTPGLLLSPGKVGHNAGVLAQVRPVTARFEGCRVALSAAVSSSAAAIVRQPSCRLQSLLCSLSQKILYAVCVWSRRVPPLQHTVR
jgi:hypothetical protein